MITFDLTDLQRWTAKLGGAQDQVGYAVSRALNKAALNTENRLATETWPQHVTVRNKSFLKAALEPEFSDKRNLRVALVDKFGRGNLRLHQTGGTATPRKGRFAIPTSRVRKGAKGVVQSQRPDTLKRKVVRGGLIFQAVGKGKASRLQLMFSVAPSNRVKADVPFKRDFERFMSEEMRREFPKAMRDAMRTRR